MSYREGGRGFRQPEKELKESEERYKDLANSLPQGVSEIDMAGNITFTNHTCLTMFGYTRDDFAEGLNIFQMMTPGDCERAQQNIGRFLKGEKQGGSEYTGLRKDGSKFPFTVYLNPVFREDKPVGFRVIVIDITDRKESEEALRASQRQLSQAMDLAHIVYWEFDTVTRTYLFDDPFYALYGTTAGQEGGYAMTTREYAKRFVHPDDRPSYQQRVKRYCAERDSQPLPDFEYRIIRRDGEVRHILAHEGVVKDDAGFIIKRYGANQDITERKEMQKALLQSEEQFRKMFEGSPIGKVLIGEDLHFIKANEAFCRMLGYTEQELVLLTSRDITHPDYVADERLRMDDLLNGRIPLYQTEKRYIRKDRGIVWGSTMVNIIRDRDGRFLYFLTTIVDITERKQSEEEKMRLESQLFRAQKMEAIGTLAGGIAHDFNNILTALVGYAALLKMKIEEATLRRYVEQILNASKKATDLVQNLLAFSRQQPVSLKPIGLHSTIRNTKRLLERLVTEDITIKTVLAPGEITVMADTTQIDQILFNLATNARDAMPKGGTLLIETRTVELDDTFKRAHGFGEPGR